MARPIMWRNYARLALFCIVPATVPTALCGLALHGEDGAVFFAVFGLFIGALATGLGLFVGWWSHRRDDRRRGRRAAGL